MSRTNRMLVGSWLVVWGVLLLLVSNHVLLGWEHIWPCILIVSGVVMLRVFQGRLNFGVVFAATWAMLLGAFLTLFSSTLIGWGEMRTLWPAIPLVIGISCFAAGKTVASNAGIVVGALVILMSATSFLYEMGTISERVAAPFIRFWPLVLVLAGFVLMKRHASRLREGSMPEGRSPVRENPFDTGALSPDVENEIATRVRAARANLRAAVLANELKTRFERFSWVGIYRLRGDALTLDDSEYVGPTPEHRRIALTDGVCGAAASQRETIIVPDVCRDSRYLACSPTVKSEIVVPILNGDALLGVLDIDSNELDAFSEDDRRFLEALVAKVSRALAAEPIAAA